MLLAFLFVCGPYSTHLTHTCILHYIYTLDVYYCLLTSLANEMYTMTLWQNKVSIFLFGIHLRDLWFPVPCPLPSYALMSEMPVELLVFRLLFFDFNCYWDFYFLRDLFLFYVNVCLCLCEQMLYVCKCLQRPGHWVSWN